MMSLSRLPRPALFLGLAGILPQAACVVSGYSDPATRFAAGAAGCFYAAVILSFLGGIWWSSALTAGERRAWPYIVAVLPSLIAWAALIPWFQGLEWPGPSLLVLGACLILSPAIDSYLARRAIAPSPAGWLMLRCILSLGLGVSTILLGLMPAVRAAPF